MYIEFHKDGKGKTFLFHVLAAQAFISNPENKPEVDHRVGCKFNCHVDNLEWATHSENLRHAFANGLEEAKRGEDNWQATMTNEQARYVRENPEGLTGKELAKKIRTFIEHGCRHRQEGQRLKFLQTFSQAPDNILRD